MPYADVNGIRLYYNEYGRGEPLLLIMGLGASALGWQNQTPFFSRHLRVIVFDNRGAGRSDKPADDYTMALLADDAAALLDELSATPAHVYGCSMGGMIAQELAIRHPAKMRTLILGATTPSPTAHPPSERAVQDLIEASRAAPEVSFEISSRQGYSAAFFEANRGYLWQRFQIELSLRPPQEAWERQAAAAGAHDTRDRLGQIKAPTLVIAGDDDPIIVPENSRALARGIERARLALLPGARHGYNVEFEDESNRLVLDFIREHGSAFTAK